MTLTYGSVCSGIESASVAWEPLGLRPAWFAEVDAAASTLLAVRFPHVVNLGDMTTIPALLEMGLIDAPDVLVGGTPCQAFSVAGLRHGLADARGQLTLAYVEIADELDRQRAASGREPCITVWENVPGVLSQSDNAFGCFLAALAGDEEPLVPGERPEDGKSSQWWTWDLKEKRHRPKWPVAGVVVGPERTAGWIVRDAQYFGLAQRRRRVFVVSSARQGFDPAAILFEFDCVRRDTPPSREAGEGFTHATAPCLTGSGRGVERTGDTRGQDPVVGVLSSDGTDRITGDPSPTWWDGSPVSQTLDAVLHKGQTMPEKNRFPAVLQPIAFQNRGSNIDANGEIAGTIGVNCDRASGGAPCVAFSSKDYGADATDDLAPTLRASGHADSHANGGSPPAVAYAFQTRIARNGRGDMGDVVNALNAQSGETGKGDAAPCVAYAIQERAVAGNPASGPDGVGVRSDDCAYTLEARSVPQAVGHAVEVLPFDTTQITSPGNYSRPAAGDPCHPLASGAHPPAVCVTEPVTHTLKAEGFDASEDGTGRGQPITTAVSTGHGWWSESDVGATLRSQDSVTKADTLAVTPQMAVRRLMPIECEALQGFPPNWTLVPVGKHKDGSTKYAADGPRYKQLGNSMPVPVMRWIGTRILWWLRNRDVIVDLIA